MKEERKGRSPRRGSSPKKISLPAGTQGTVRSGAGIPAGENERGGQGNLSERHSSRILSFPFLILCVMLFCISAFAGYQYTATHDNGTVSGQEAAMGAVSITQNCNIREAPGTVSAVIGSGTEGEVYEYAGSTEITGEDSQWYSIRFEGGIGWVSEAVAELTID